MKALSTGFIGLFLSQCFTLAQMTYWVDPACRKGEKGQRFNDAIEGAIEIARHSQERLAKQDDELQARNFKTLFHVKRTDHNARNTVDGDYDLVHFTKYACH